MLRNGQLSQLKQHNFVIFRHKLVVKCIFYCLTVASNFLKKFHALLKYQRSRSGSLFYTHPVHSEL